MRGRGRGQLGTLGTLLPRQTGRMRLAAALGARANTDSNSTGDQPSTDRTPTGRTAADSTAVDHSSPDRTARTRAADSLANSTDAFANTSPWRHASASSP